MVGVRHAARVTLVVAAVAVLLGVAITATSIVPVSRAGSTSAGAPTANQLKPPQCAALNLNGILVGSGTITDNNQPHLVLGSSGVDTIRGGAGNDCILGGGGNDSLRGDGGVDVCIGGPGTDTFFNSCETQIQ